MSEQINKIVQIILENYTNPQFNVDYLACKLGISRSFLRELVYTNYGISVRRLIETIRLENAIKLLANQSEIIERIRVKTGYAYSKTFRTAFKKRLNYTPEELKNIFLNAVDKDTDVQNLIKILWNNTC